MEFKEARIRAGLTQENCALYLNLSVKTIKTYDSGKAPKTALELMNVLAGEFPSMTASRGGFKGWGFKNGLLYSESGDVFSSGDILAIKSDRELIKELLKEKSEKMAISGLDNVIPFPVINKNKALIA